MHMTAPTHAVSEIEIVTMHNNKVDCSRMNKDTYFQRLSSYHDDCSRIGTAFINVFSC